MKHPNRSRALYRAAALLLVGALAACSDTSAPTAAAGGEDPLIEVLVAMGAARENIQDRGDHFIVEGDIKVFKKDLRAPQPNDGKAHPGQPSYQLYGTVVAQNRRIITVDLSAIDAENASWAAATRAAMSNWSAVSNAYIRFVEGGTPDITITFVNTLGSCVVAQGSFPASGAPGTTVQVSRAYTGSYTYSKQVWIMTHELGHNIGMYHTDQGFGTQVPNTPTSDGNSVMNSGAAFGGCPPAVPNWGGFSTHDQTAARYLYPLLPPTGLTATSSGGNVYVSWNAHPGATTYEVKRIDQRVYDNYYESWQRVNTDDTGWWEQGGGFSSGTAYTGDSYCVLYNTGYEQETTEAWYEVRVVYSTGVGPIATIGANDLTC